MKKSVLFSLLATLGFLPVTRGDLTLVQSIEGSRGNNTVTIKIKGERARIEINPKAGVIVNTKTGEVISLLHDRQAVMRLSPEKAKDLANKARTILQDTETSLEVPTPRPTGRKEKILGYDSDEYVAETPKYRATYWVAKGYPDYGAILRQMKLLQNAAFVSVRKPMPEYYDFPGLPIRTKIKFTGQEETSITLTSISQSPLPDSEFDVPAGYAEIHLPDLELHSPAPASPQPSSEKPEGQ